MPVFNRICGIKCRPTGSVLADMANSRHGATFEDSAVCRLRRAAAKKRSYAVRSVVYTTPGEGALQDELHVLLAPDTPGAQVGEVGDGDARDKDETRSERLVIQSGLRETLSYRMP